MYAVRRDLAKMDDSDDSVNNMVSNLPLLFANGYPTSLEKITETQIQKFIPFMVQCSLGNINVPGKEEYNEPEWWPEDIEFTIPITRPKRFQGDWLQKMKEIVKICYQFHKSIFLLRFCNDLAAYEHTWLRFINNHNSTTSLYDRRCNKLLVTFRNENMTYDQPPQKRICLLQQKARTQNDNNQQQMVEQSLFDIYLCDNCDAELYSSEAYKEHEKICTSDDDDVIFCNSTTPITSSSYACKDEAQPTQKESNTVSEESCRDFLLNFQLFSKKCIDRTQSLSPSIEYQNNEDSNNSNNSNTNSLSNNNNNNNNNNNLNKNKNNNNINKLTKEINNPTRKPGRPRVHILEDNNIIDRNDRKSKVTRNNRTIYALTRCPNIPFSSPAGQMLIRNFRSYVHKEYLTERLDRVERFCATPILQSGCPRPAKFFGKQRYSLMNNINCTYKKPSENSTHKYVFPRRQYFSQYRADSLKFLNDLILKKRCRPITVRLRKITDSEIKRKRRSSHCSNTSIVNSDLNIKLIRDQSHGSTKWKITHQQQQIQQQQNRQRKLIQELEEQQQNLVKPQRQKNYTENLIVEETIDLCSTDEELDQDSNDVSNSRPRSKVYINNSYPLAQIIPIQETKNKDYQISENGIIVNDDDDDDDDVLQIVDECPVQLDRLIKPTHLNVLQFSSGRPPRLEVQTLLRKLNSENEITVTPLKKVLDPLALTPIESSSNIILSRTSIQNTYNASNIIEEIRKQNKYEKNFLTSNITNASKPMQPSVFLFSNYTANSTGSNNTTPTTTMILQQQLKNDLNSKSNNQENLIDNSNNSNNSLYKNKNTDDVWLPNNNLSNNLNNNISNLTTTTANNNNSSLNHLRQNNLNSVITNSPLILNTASQLHNPAAVVAQATNVAANKLLQWQINSPNRPFSVDLTL